MVLQFVVVRLFFSETWGVSLQQLHQRREVGDVLSREATNLR
jgi:hypothetical protein